MDKKILENIEQQLKRLLEQLKDLEEYKNELDPEEYKQMKNDTLQELEIFQTKLQEIEQGDLTLKNAIQQQQEQLRAAIKNSFNAEEIKHLMSSSQGTQIREKIKKLDQDHTLQRINQAQYVKETLNCLNQLQDIGIPFTQQEINFINSNTGKDNFVIKQDNVQGKTLLKSAEQQLAANNMK
ncbi:unnamed protein product [Paramecium pentaurelia]|uniref:Uncharacterized protein n=1 Tax=Paramecium pentaurelia TaxID=43138 RepID=A0A8S1SBZ3_9CILI|nr:unnamed protein product [Paramecium pentaurelia]